MNYHKDMTIQEVIYSHDMVLEIFSKFGLPCSTCGGAAFETLEVAARVHNCDLIELMRDLNNIYNEEK